jgi:hypothetical protein
MARAVLGEKTASAFLAAVERDVLDETADLRALTQLIHLTLITILGDVEAAGARPGSP